ncbi:MAG: hypothetical protein WBA68_07265 [Alteraurantiacibacter sp.]
MRLAGTFHRDLLIGLALRGAGAVASFALTWMIARIYGPGEVGLFHIGLASAMLAGTIVSAGLDIVLVRELGALLAEDRRADIRATYERCRAATLWLGIPVALLLAGLSTPLSRLLEEPRAAIFVALFAPFALLAPLTKLGNALLRSVGRVVASQALEGVSYSTIACAVLGLAWALLGGPDPVIPVIAYLTGLAMVFALNTMLVRATLAGAGEGGTAAIVPRDGWRIAGLQVVTTGGMWGVLALVTAWLDIVDAGVFRTAFQVCMVLQLVNAAFAVMAGPHIAKAVAAGDGRAVVRQVASGGALGVGLCLLPLLVAAIFATELLALFGPEFPRAAPTLRVLLAAPMLDVAFGLTGVSLLMMRADRFVLLHEIVATIAGLAALVLLLPKLGLLAAAIGVVTTAAIRALLNAARFAVETRGMLSQAAEE